MRTLTWDQVNSWRLSQHGLAPRLEGGDLVEAAVRTCGIQAQVMSAAELALWARVEGLTPQDAQSALWQHRTLIKTWAMRGTLHLMPAGDLALCVAARSVYEARNWLAYFDYFGISEAQYYAFMVAVPQVLGDEPMTREALAAEIGRKLGAPELTEKLLASSWGSLWKPSAWRGDLCFGPNQGRNVTFVRPAAWLGLPEDQQQIEPYEALCEVGRRYLRAYGPATPENFARWWDGGAGLSQAKKLFRSLGDEVEEVDVEGWHGIALRTTLDSMQHLEAPENAAGVVRLLPLFDAYTLGIGRDIEPLLPAAYKNRVFRPQGWISAVVLIGGRMEGVWEHKLQRSGTAVKVRMFSPPGAQVRKAIEAEAERLNGFWGTDTAVTFEDH